jgi:hypothetical protein
MSAAQPRGNHEMPVSVDPGLTGNAPGLQNGKPYPHLRRALSLHLEDISVFVALSQPDAAQAALRMALSIKAEIDGPDEGWL